MNRSIAPLTFEDTD